MQTQHRTNFAANLFFVVGREKERHHRSGSAGRRFDHMWPVANVCTLIEVLKLFARVRCVLSEVVVTAVGNSPSSPQPQGKRNSTSEVPEE